MNTKLHSEILAGISVSLAPPWRSSIRRFSQSLLPELIKHLVMVACWLSPIAAVAQSVDVIHLGQWPGYERRGAHGVAIAGDYAYVGSADLHVLDIRQPANLKLVAVAQMPGDARGVAVSGHHVCVINERFDTKLFSDLLVFDVSDPTAPRLTAQLQDDNFGFFTALAVGGGYACVGDQGVYNSQTGNYVGGRLRIIDISDPANPTQVGALAVNGIQDVEIVGNYAYLAAGSDGLQVIDISVPSSPRRVGSVNYGATAFGVAVEGQQVFLAEYGGLRVVDVSNPALPVQLGSLEISLSYVWDVTVSGGYAFAAAHPGLHVIDVSNPVNPLPVIEVEVGYGSGGIAIAGQLAFMGGSNLAILDISTPHLPQLLSQHELSGEAEDVAVSGSYAYLADGGNGLRVIDISEPTHPQLANSYRPAGQSVVKDLFVSGDFAYLAVSHEVDGANPQWLHRLEVVDISDPANPYLFGQAYAVSASNPQAVTVSGSIAYLATGYNGVETFDVSNPADPQWLGQYDRQKHAIDVAVSGHYAFVAFDSNEISMDVLDVSDPSNPRLVGSIAIGSAWNLAVSGDYAYLGGYSGLRVVDISNPAAPRLVGAFTKGWDVFVAGNRAFASNLPDGGLHVLDVSDPANPQQLGAYNTGEWGGYGITVAGDQVFVAHSYSGLQIFRVDASAPAPQLLSAITDNDLRLRWPSAAAGFLLEASANATSSTWDPVPGTPQLNGDEYEMILPMDSPSRFFRLRKP